MSERIRELAEQCVGDRPYNNSFDYEKFAELIIQEYIGKKEWVGLTDQEVMVAAYQAGFDIHEDYENEDDPETMHWWTPDGEACDDSLLKLRDLIEAKLKERNG